MKQINAYIKPIKLDEVELALHHVEGLSGMSLLDVKGCGRERHEEQEKDSGKGQEEHISITRVPHIKIEIICTDELCEEIVKTIQKAAHTGLRGDGKIYVSNVESAIRISTGESGKDAI